MAAIFKFVDFNRLLYSGHRLVGHHSAKTTWIRLQHRNCNRVQLQPIHDALGPVLSSALPGFHSITGSDTTGKIRGVGKKSALKVLLKSPPHVITALANLGQGDSPTPDVITGCEAFLCSLVSTNSISAQDPATLRWKKFSQLSKNQSANMLPPTAGAWRQHIYRAHMQAHLWAQDNILDPIIPDPCKLGWSWTDDRLLPLLSADAAAPEAVVELLKCNCGKSYCSRRCTCKQNNLPCTQLCKCSADENCCNTHAPAVTDDNDDD